VKNVFLDKQEQFGVFVIFKRSFPNNIFSVFISKPKFLMPQNIVLFVQYSYMLKRNDIQTQGSFLNHICMRQLNFI